MSLAANVAVSRLGILDAVVALLQAITDLSGDTVIKYAEAAKAGTYNFENVPFPCCYVYFRNSAEAKDKAIMGNHSETWRSSLVVELVVDDDTADVTMGYIDNKLNENYTMGGFVCEGSFISIDDFVVAADEGMYDGRLLTYELIHRNSR